VLLQLKRLLFRHCSLLQFQSTRCNFAKYSPILNVSFTYRLRNKPFLIGLLTTPPHLKYVVTRPCNLLLMACFGDINVSQCSVATYAKCNGTLISLNCKFTKESSSDFLNRSRFDRIMVMMSLWPRLFGPPLDRNDNQNNMLSASRCLFCGRQRRNGSIISPRMSYDVFKLH